MSEKSWGDDERVPNLSYESRWKGSLVAGIDEAGCGPLAGPVVAAAVILAGRRLPKGLNDSKKLTAPLREALALEIRARHRFGIGEASVEEIDSHNILKAAHLAMRRSLAALGEPAPVALLIDGNRDPKLGLATELIVKGDEICASIAAASILAKVARDSILIELGRAFPDYGFERHKGYGTPDHLQALQRLGPTQHHRRSFAPVYQMLCKESS